MDKSSWRAGPWQDEPDKRQWTDPTTGFPCLIVRSSLGALCGYVGVPRGHAVHGVSYMGVPAEAHGGLTYSDSCAHGDEAQGICHVPAPGAPDDVWWLGFDCAHSGDLVPPMAFRAGEVYRGFDYVAAEVTALAAQFAGILLAERP